MSSGLKVLLTLGYALTLCGLGFLGCSAGKSPPLSTRISSASPNFEEASLPIGKSATSYVANNLFPTFVKKRQVPEYSNGEYRFILLEKLTPAGKQSYDRLFDTISKGNPGGVLQYLKDNEPIEIHYHKKSNQLVSGTTGEQLAISGSARAKIARLIAYDNGSGLYLHSPRTSFRMYFTLISKHNLRYFTETPAGIMDDKTYLDLCQELSLFGTSELLLDFVRVAKNGWGAVPLEARSPQEIELLFDLVGIAMSEEYRRLSEYGELIRKKPNRIVDPFALLKTGLLMLSEPRHKLKLCNSFARSFIATKELRQSMQRGVSARLGREFPEQTAVYASMLDLDRADLIESLDGYIRVGGAPTSEENEALDNLFALIERKRGVKQDSHKSGS